jgi:hypothetical protein
MLQLYVLLSASSIPSCNTVLYYTDEIVSGILYSRDLIIDLARASVIRVFAARVTIFGVVKIIGTLSAVTAESVAHAH